MAVFPFDVLAWLVRGRYKLTPVVLSDGDTSEVAIDVNANVKTRIVGGPIIGGYDRTVTPANSKVARAVPCKLVELWGFNDDPVQTLYLQLHNSASAPLPNAVPLETVAPVGPGEPVAFRPGDPIPFGFGLTWAISTTPDVYTAPTDSTGFVLTVVYQ